MFAYKITYRIGEEDEKTITRELDGDWGYALDTALLLFVLFEAFPDDRSLGRPVRATGGHSLPVSETIGEAMARYGIESIKIENLLIGIRREIDQDQLFRP